MKCNRCNRELARYEIEYYETLCEQCERDWLDAIEHWRHGGRNDYFDKLYDGKKSNDGEA